MRLSRSTIPEFNYSFARVVHLEAAKRASRAFVHYAYESRRDALMKDLIEF